jgi:hypothetical protein
LLLLPSSHRIVCDCALTWAGAQASASTARVSSLTFMLPHSCAAAAGVKSE